MSFQLESLLKLDEFDPKSVACVGEHRTIEVNGVSIYYEVAGAGRPVILTHGNGGCHQNLYQEIRQLSQAGYQVYAPDTRGQGANAPLPEYHYADMAEDIYQMICKLGLGHPAYFGWSDGAIIFLYLELLHPGTISYAVLAGGNYDATGTEDAFVAFLAQAKAEMEAKGQRLPLFDLMMNEPDLKLEALRRIETPVLVLAGSDDVIKPEHTRAMAEALPNATLVTLPGEDHGSYIQDSPIAGHMILEFLKLNRY